MLRCLFIFSLTFVVYCTNAQKNHPVRNLVFEGAGIRGIAYCGVLQALEEQHLLDSVQRVGGTSAGALIALSVSLGYQGAEIERLINTTLFRTLNDGRYIFLGGFNRLRKYYGWYRGNKVDGWIGGIVKEKTGDPDITFGELHRRGFKDLYVTGTNLSRQQLVVFSYERYPLMKVKDAVRISMSIPLYFKASFMDSAGRTFQKPAQNLSIMADGGFVANFPVKIFDSARYTGASSNLHSVNPETLGFRIDRDEQIVNDRQQKGLAAMPIRNLKGYVAAFYNLVIENLNRQTLTEADWLRTVSISDGEIGPRIRKLSGEEIHRLEENGYRATLQYLALPAPEERNLSTRATGAR